MFQLIRQCIQPSRGSVESSQDTEAQPQPPLGRSSSFSPSLSGGARWLHDPTGAIRYGTELSPDDNERLADFECVAQRWLLQLLRSEAERQATAHATPRDRGLWREAFWHNMPAALQRSRSLPGFLAPPLIAQAPFDAVVDRRVDGHRVADQLVVMAAPPFDSGSKAVWAATLQEQHVGLLLDVTMPWEHKEVVACHYTVDANIARILGMNVRLRALSEDASGWTDPVPLQYFVRSPGSSEVPVSPAQVLLRRQHFTIGVAELQRRDNVSPLEVIKLAITPHQPPCSLALEALAKVAHDFMTRHPEASVAVQCGDGGRRSGAVAAAIQLYHKACTGELNNRNWGDTARQVMRGLMQRRNPLLVDDARWMAPVLAGSVIWTETFSRRTRDQSTQTALVTPQPPRRSASLRPRMAPILE